MGIITKREEWAKEKNQRIDRDTTRCNQLDFTKTEFSLDSEEERPLKTKAKLWSKFRIHWGTVVNTHGHQGAVRVHFKRNLPPRAMGAKVRVMLYPNKQH